MAEKVLIVDDDRELRSILCDVLQAEGYATAEASDGLEVDAVLKSAAPDAVILDMKMPRRGGLETLREIKKTAPGIPVFMLTAYAEIPTAVEAVKLGAYDFVPKPPDFDLLVLSLRKALDTNRLERELRLVTTALTSSLGNTFGVSEAIGKVIAQVAQVSRTDLAVIVQGETGTGKSYIANAIHTLGRRAGKPFVRVDISTIPETLAESELFGTKKGAYTGSDRDRAGFFASAEGGTVFLDDIENMSAPVQAKLLDVIEHKRVVPVGSSDSVGVDFRVIAATNKDLRGLMARQLFRDDLFYRLGEFMIVVPPLRERPEDIRFFIDRFLAESSAEMERPVRGCAGDAIAHLLEHRWPGNVRELKNVMRRAVLLAKGEIIRREDIDLLIRGADPAGAAGAGLSLKAAVREVERQLVSRAMAQANGNKARAARLLGVSYPCLLAKIKDFDGPAR